MYYQTAFIRYTLISLTLGLNISCTPREQVESVSISVTYGLLNSLFWIAQEKGFFKDQGLNITFTTYPSGKRALEGMLSTNAQLSTTAGSPFTAQLPNHPDLRIIATLGTSDNELKIVTRTDRGIEKPSDLEGKIITTQKASAVHFFLHLFLLQNYISDQDVSLRFMKAEELPIALKEGIIDAFSMREPFITQARELLSGKINVFSEPALYRKTYHLVSSEAYIRQHPEVIKKLLRAFLLAEKYIETNAVETKIIMSQLANTDNSMIEEIWDNFVLRVVLDQDLLLQLQLQKEWSRNLFPNNHSPLTAIETIHLDALMQVAPERVGLKPIPPSITDNSLL